MPGFQIGTILAKMSRSMTKPTKCAQRRLRSAWAYDHIRLRRSIWILYTYIYMVTQNAHSEDWSNWLDAQADLNT